MSTPTVTLPTIPAPLAWGNEPLAWELDPNQTLHITAGSETDMFHDPNGQLRKQNSPQLLFPAPAQFTLSAQVAVDFQATYDAGVLLVYVSDLYWAKLCFELSPQHQPMVVSVVTNDLSDDCNSVALERPAVYLRVTCLGPAFAFHYSLDNHYWQLVRYFSLRQMAPLRAGFSAQSPTGSSCKAAFHDITYSLEPILDIRSGM